MEKDEAKKDIEETQVNEESAEQAANAENNESVSLSKEEQQELLNKVKELEAMKENLLRSAAEYENAKKRLAKDREEFIRFNQESLLRELLPVLDNFERALSHSKDIKDEGAKGVISGIEMVQKQFQEILKQQGLKKQETVGQQFDPNLHEAIAYLKEEGKEDEIVNEVQAGYLLHDRLLRAAKVQVRGPQEENS